ncbi:hypothetical protein FQN57_004731 [Myotisia sp. PD_48]|nr:hypothetical protein FQN57_004731 [Myotisia sp. PD_48]
MHTTTPNNNFLVLIPQSQPVAQIDLAPAPKAVGNDNSVEVGDPLGPITAATKTHRSPSNDFISPTDSKPISTRFLRLGP